MQSESIKSKKGCITENDHEGHSVYLNIRHILTHSYVQYNPTFIIKCNKLTTLGLIRLYLSLRLWIWWRKWRYEVLSRRMGVFFLVFQANCLKAQLCGSVCHNLNPNRSKSWEKEPSRKMVRDFFPPFLMIKISKHSELSTI